MRVRVSERATVEATLARCRTSRVLHRLRTVCKTAKTLTAHPKKAGTAELTIPRKLKPGRYRVTLQATDRAHSRKLVRTVRLRAAKRQH